MDAMHKRAPRIREKAGLPCPNARLAPSTSRFSPSRNLKIMITCILVYITYINMSWPVAMLRPKLSESELWTKEVVALVTELYELLQTMQYLKPGAIQYAPHGNDEMGINTTLTTLMGLTPESVYLLRSLPYIKKTPGPYYSQWSSDGALLSATNWNAYRYTDELLITNAFADMRDDATLKRSRQWLNGDRSGSPDDKYVAFVPEGQEELDDEVPLLKPWYVALTEPDYMGSYSRNDSTARGGAMVLNLKTRNLWNVGMGGGKYFEYADGSFDDRGSIDTVTKGELAAGAKETKSRVERAKVEMYASRSATETLRDYIERFRSLEWVPGFVEGDSMVGYHREAYHKLYRDHGWPDNFTGVTFMNARQAWDMEKRANYLAAEPIRNLKQFELQHDHDKKSLEQWKGDLQVFESPDSTSHKGYSKWSQKYYGKTLQNAIAHAKESIEIVSKRYAEYEGRCEEIKRRADEVPDKAKEQRDEMLRRWGGDHCIGNLWEITKFE